jgi:hypothetical protein
MTEWYILGWTFVAMLVVLLAIFIVLDRSHDRRN